jgi:peptidoglycan hydrolase CwlO-like protein
METSFIVLTHLAAFMVGMALVDSLELDAVKKENSRQSAMIHNQCAQLEMLRQRVKEAEERVEDLEADKECLQEELEEREDRIDKLKEANNAMEKDLASNEVAIVNCAVAWVIAILFTALMVFTSIIKSSPILRIAA